MDLLTLLYVFSVTFLGLTKGAGVLPNDLNAAVGGNVMFTTTLSPTPLQSTVWQFNGNIMVISSSTSSTPLPGYEDRVTVDLSTGSLELRNVSVNDSGTYTVAIVLQNADLDPVGGQTTLTVQVPISNVEITPSRTDLNESSSVRLSCSSSGSSPSFRWLNVSSEVTADDRVQITDGGSVMTIVSVSRYDQGPFKCVVSNLVSTETSAPVTFTINYGPENVTLQVSPPLQYHPEGSDVTLSCLAVSEPLPEFKWFVDENTLADTGEVFTLRNIQMAQSGNYSCQAFNTKTMKKETSRPLLISVLKNISDVSVEPSTAQPLEGQSLNLTCDASGSVFTTEWMKDGSNLNSNDNIMFYDNNTVLSFKNLHRNDHGIYTCRVSNPVSSVSSTYTMVVNYGPEDVQISGPSKVDVGTPLTLSCSADSTPTATYTWKHNGTDFHHSSVFTKNSTEFSDSGEYICQATNSITDKTESKTLKLEVTGASGSKCDTGCIVGIVFGCLAVILLVAALVLVIVKKKYLMDKFSKRTSNRTEGEGQDNATYGGNEELNYADVKFFKNRNGGKVQVGQQNEVSEYAAVRVNNRPPTAVSLPTYNAHMERTTRPAPQPNDNDPQYAQVRRN